MRSQLNFVLLLNTNNMEYLKSVCADHPKTVFKFVQEEKGEDGSPIFIADTIREMVGSFSNKDKIKFITQSKDLYRLHGRGLLSLKFASVKEAVFFACEIFANKSPTKMRVTYMPAVGFLSGIDFVMECLKTYDPEKQAVLLIEVHINKGKYAGHVVYRHVVLELKDEENTKEKSIV